LNPNSKYKSNPCTVTFASGFYQVVATLTVFIGRGLEPQNITVVIIGHICCDQRVRPSADSITIVASDIPATILFLLTNFLYLDLMNSKTRS
jgi:hypothetical protein